MENRRSCYLAVLALSVVCLFSPLVMRGQSFSVATNALDYANYGTMNVEGAVAAGRHWSLTAVAKYNPFLHRKRDGEALSARQQLYGAGVRYWPWHVYAGWWAGARMQYQEYNRGGIQSAQTDEGDRYGLGLSGGYSYMLTPHWNLDFGLGVWGGYDKFTTYSCPVCGATTAQGSRLFLLPSDLLVSLVYVF